jgi:hypothetical protein
MDGFGWARVTLFGMMAEQLIPFAPTLIADSLQAMSGRARHEVGPARPTFYSGILAEYRFDTRYRLKRSAGAPSTWQCDDDRVT